MKYSSYEHNRQFSLPYTDGMDMTIKVRHFKQTTLYDIYVDERLQGTIYKEYDIWHTHDHIDAMVVDMIAARIEKHEA